MEEDKRKNVTGRLGRVGIITMHRVINYGSALQTYATCELVKKQGFSPVVIDYQYPSRYHLNFAEGCENKKGLPLWKNYLKKCLIFLGIWPLAYSFKNWLSMRRNVRNANFTRFIEQFSLTKSYSKESILKDAPEFDVYLTGSDQTWNPRYLHEDYSFLLNFAPDNVPKISYAASFGCLRLPEQYEVEYRKYLSRYDRISVRECSGVPLVKDLCGKDAVHVLDPTLMLTKEDWKKLKIDFTGMPGNFIFCYCLDYVFNPAPEIFSLLSRIQKIMNIPIVFFADATVLKKEATAAGFIVADIGSPEAFVSHYLKASFIVSTSFHGAAFAVNFNKDFFMVLNPNSSKDDRVRNLLTAVGLEHRGLDLKNIEVETISENDLHVDFTECNLRLTRMRKISTDYLTEALLFCKEKCFCQEKK